MLESEKLQREDIADLFDFIYIDRSRIDSYYAQAFDGKLESSTTTTSEADANEREKSLGQGSKLFGIRNKTTSGTNLQQSQLVSPHDVAIVDALHYLDMHGFIKNDFESARSGDVIMVSGTLYFYDTTMLRQAKNLTEAFASILEDGKMKQGAATITAVLNAIDLPSVFMLDIDDRFTVGGIVNEAYLSESIPAHSMKYGDSGMENVHVLGIREMPFRKKSRRTQYIRSTHDYAKALRELVFGDDAHAVSPIAIFRKIR